MARSLSASIAVFVVAAIIYSYGVAHKPVPTPTPTATASGVVLVSNIVARCRYRFTDDGTALSDPKCTPGATNPNLTIAVLCSPSFRTAPYRTGVLAFPAPITAAKKTAAYTRYGVSAAQRNMSMPNVPTKYLWEVDHLFSLEDLGDDEDENVWPQPSRFLKLSYDVNGHLTAELLAVPTSHGYEDKDVIENRVHASLCDGTGDAQSAQASLSNDWPQQLQGAAAPGKAHTSDDEDSSP